MKTSLLTGNYHWWIQGKGPTPPFLDCKTVVFFLKISKENGKAWRKLYF